MIIDYRTIHNTSLDSLVCDVITGCVARYLSETGFDHENLNFFLATFEAEHIICSAPVMGLEQHASISVMRDGHVVSRSIIRTPLLTHDQALGEAMKLAEQHSI